MPRNIVVRGRPGSGKSTAISLAIDYLRKNGVKITGMVTPEVRKGGIRMGFEALNLLTGEKVVLASVGQRGPSVGKYGVNLTLFNEFLLGLRLDEGDAIFIDEVGKMELMSDLFQSIVEKALDMEKPAVFTAPFYDLPFIKRMIARRDVELIWINRGESELVAKRITDRVLSWLKEGKGF
ncbi:MAG: nucleoside-triphosphatase [Candidatus Methanodesulfokora sp.]